MTYTRTHPVDMRSNNLFFGKLSCTFKQMWDGRCVGSRVHLLQAMCKHFNCLRFGRDNFKLHTCNHCCLVYKHFKDNCAAFAWLAKQSTAPNKQLKWNLQKYAFYSATSFFAHTVHASHTLPVLSAAAFDFMCLYMCVRALHIHIYSCLCM